MYPLPLIAIFLVLLIAELTYLAVKRRGWIDSRELASSGFIFVGYKLSNVLNGIIITGLYFFFYRYRILNFETYGILLWVFGFVLLDFTYYIHHRLSHSVRWLWAHHSVHHSSTQLTLIASLRQGWTYSISGAWMIWQFNAILGIPPTVAFTCMGIIFFYHSILHTEAVPKLGVLESLLQTPANHRVHHFNQNKKSHHNFGGILTVFDRLLGTDLREQTPSAGVSENATPIYDPFKIVFSEYRLMAYEFLSVRGIKPRLQFIATIFTPR